MDSVIAGISEDTEDHHIVKAALEAICFQVKDIMDVMSKQCGLSIQSLKVNQNMELILIIAYLVLTYDLVTEKSY